MERKSHHWATRLPFFYGWLIVAIAFVTMAIAVTARTWKGVGRLSNGRSHGQCEPAASGGLCSLISAGFLHGTLFRFTRRNISSRSGSAPSWQLGRWVSVVAIPGQIGLGALSDRIGREWVWSAGCFGFAICYVALIALEYTPSPLLLDLMVISQGFLGYALTSVMGPIVAEIFEEPHYGSIFGTVTVALVGGGAAGPWVAGIVHDETGSYGPAFLLAIA